MTVNKMMTKYKCYICNDVIEIKDCTKSIMPCRRCGYIRLRLLEGRAYTKTKLRPLKKKVKKK